MLLIIIKLKVHTLNSAVSVENVSLKLSKIKYGMGIGKPEVPIKGKIAKMQRTQLHDFMKHNRVTIFIHTSASEKGVKIPL